MKANILGVKVDQINMPEALKMVEKWLGERHLHRYITTPNVEIIMAAQKDQLLKKILNESDLAISDSSRLGWAHGQLNDSSLVKKMFLWPLFLLPKLSPYKKFPVLTGTDLMEKLISESEEKGFVIGLLGGKNRVAERLSECLKLKYPNLKIGFVLSKISVDNSGNIMQEIDNHTLTGSEGINEPNLKSDVIGSGRDFGVKDLKNKKIDILFVAFGHGKQEKWIYNNKDLLNCTVMMGVGGAFDYLSGDIARAPYLFRVFGLEWLFRLIIEPWRITRFGSLVEFVFKILFSNDKKIDLVDGKS